MLNFDVFGKAVAAQFQAMTRNGLYVAEIDKDLLWETYLSAFPPGSNPIYRERTEHDCTCCKQFVRALGAVVSFKDDGTLATIWDVQVDGPYQVVANAMAKLVRSARFASNKFLHYEPKVGTATSLVQVPDSTEIISWTHFCVNLPKSVVVPKSKIGEKLNDSRTAHDVFLRALDELLKEDVETVIELIEQSSLYRGEEHLRTLEDLRGSMKLFREAKTKEEKDALVWNLSSSLPASVVHVRNSAIGTLLVDLAEGKELEDAVKAFEAKVGAQNYKRPTALVSKAMIKRAQEKIEELGFTSALERRFATIDDITINNVLFADRSVKKVKNVFDAIADEARVDEKKFAKVEEISIEDFVSKILPKVSAIEMMVENRHANNLVSLIAPVDPTARGMFRWNNNFSWSYAGDAADSIKERVKRAGGNVAGDFRASLSWRNFDDLDLHLLEPKGGKEIYYGDRRNEKTRGELDVDMNAGYGATRTPVENITYPSRARMLDGTYELSVHQFYKREMKDVGFEVEIEFDGKTFSFSHPKSVAQGSRIVVARFVLKKDSWDLQSVLPSNSVSKTVWGVPTQTFRKVNVVMMSPNFWDDNATGNKHYFFMLDGCANGEKARGFYNEFFGPELTPHRKVLEIVGAKMRTDESNRQLSGLGFSSTKRDEVLVRVSGAFTRALRVKF